MQQGFLSHFITVPEGIPFTFHDSGESRTHHMRLKTLVKVHPVEGCYWVDERGRTCHTAFANIFSSF